jgi:hypothetical protein
VGDPPLSRRSHEGDDLALGGELVGHAAGQRAQVGTGEVQPAVNQRLPRAEVSVDFPGIDRVIDGRPFPPHLQPGSELISDRRHAVSEHPEQA